MLFFKMFLAAVALVGLAQGVSAATVLGVDGPRTGSTTLGLGQLDIGVAQTFTTTEDVNNASFAFDIRCFDCSGDLWLIEGVMGTSILPNDVVVETTFSSASGANSALTDLEFFAGTYTIIMSMTGGNGYWRATDTPTQLGTAGVVANEYHKFSQISSNYLPWSATTLVADNSLMFSVITPDQPPLPAVPLPASAWLLLASMGCVATLRSRA